MKHKIHIWWSYHETRGWFIHRMTNDLRNWDGSTLTEHDVIETIEVQEPKRDEQ